MTRVTTEIRKAKVTIVGGRKRRLRRPTNRDRDNSVLVMGKKENKEWDII